MAEKLIHVVLMGASGRTGTTISNAILEQPDVFKLTAFARPSSIDKQEYVDLRKRGVTIVPGDMAEINEDLIETMRDADVVICTATLANLSATPQIEFARAAHKAGVKRFVPSLFAPCNPGRDGSFARDAKEDIKDDIKAIGLPYTFIDVGWWYQLSLPRLPSGRIDDKLEMPLAHITGSGDVGNAMIDNANIGSYVARIIADPQTLNRYVLAYDEVWSQNQIFDLLERLSGENLPRKHMSQDVIEKRRAELQEEFSKGDHTNLMELALLDYFYSMCILGENTPQKAKELGYLIANELYPDVKGTKYEDYVKKVLESK